MLHIQPQVQINICNDHLFGSTPKICIIDIIIWVYSTLSSLLVWIFHQNNYDTCSFVKKGINFVKIFVNCPILKNFQPEIFSGHLPTESIRTQDSENVYERWVLQMFDPVLVARSWVSATKWGPLAKLWGVAKKSHSHNFRIWAFKFKSLVAIDYGNKWFTFGSSNSKNVGDTFFCNG